MSKKEFKKETKRIERVIGKSLASETKSEQGPMILYMVKLGFSTMTVEQQLFTGRDVVTKMTGNPNFPTPSPALADVTIALDALEVAQQNMRTTPGGRSIRDARRRELKRLMSELQSYVDFTAKGNIAIAASSGMEVNDPRNPIGFLPPPTGLEVTNTKTLGKLKLNWPRVPKNFGYRIEWTQSLESNVWQNTQSARSEAFIGGLNPGERYFFRVATLSHDGFEGYTAPVAIWVLVQ